MTLIFSNVNHNTVNVLIFAGTNFRVSMKINNIRGTISIQFQFKLFKITLHTN